jgi:uncharacterized protein (DUF433 family)
MERSAMPELQRITRDPEIMGGKPCIRGMRVTVGTILGLLADGHREGEILEVKPYLEPGDIRAALSYAAWRLEEQGYEAMHWSQVGEARSAG